ncbi:bifunctional UDP-N-acetylglucosamine diphosphorylase/glucosamine-1-phosphate N-acetyltransferase GlmU [Pseudactinotalea sp. HY160]|nr:bifunctional UDP-N-acetylglucosamine diphosphorylase/glucosamine-1-phosphate N-acetyltransferase GlmU [Pseudactinotalea sp. HY160]
MTGGPAAPGWPPAHLPARAPSPTGGVAGGIRVVAVSQSPAAVIVLAAGQGTRMRSSLPKVLHAIGGRSLLGHVLAAGRSLGPDHLAVVVRHDRERVAAHVRELDPAAIVADQDEVPGTGRATQCALAALPADLSGPVVVLAGDVPLLDEATLRGLLAEHAAGNAVTILSTDAPDPTGYGRIVRDGDGQVTGIVEHRDASAAQLEITEINSAVYVFDAAILRSGLARIGTDNAQGELYLTDVIGQARADGGRVAAVRTLDAVVAEGVNDKAQLATLGAELNRRLLGAHMRAGVTIVDPTSVWVDVGVDLAPDCEILPGVQLHGATSVATGARIGPDTTLTDTRVGAGAEVVRSHVLDSRIEAGARVGPYAYLRQRVVVGPGAKIGTFVEAKNTRLDDGAKIPHLSYMGDATIGAGANVGAGSITANYDGVHKHPTVVGPQARAGSNTMFVAPVELGAGAYTGAGTTLREDVPAGALAVSTAGERIIEGWTRSRRPGTPSADAAAAADAADAADTAAAADPALTPPDPH